MMREARYSYPARLTPEESNGLDEEAYAIRRLGAQGLACVLEAGERLLQAKKQLRRGEFGIWVENRCGLSLSTAENLMRVARQFGTVAANIRNRCENGEPEVIQPSALYDLSRDVTPPEARQRAFEAIQNGEPVTQKAAREWIKQARITQDAEMRPILQLVHDDIAKLQVNAIRRAEEPKLEAGRELTAKTRDTQAGVGWAAVRVLLNASRDCTPEQIAEHCPDPRLARLVADLLERLGAALRSAAVDAAEPSNIGQESVLEPWGREDFAQLSRWPANSSADELHLKAPH